MLCEFMLECGGEKSTKFMSDPGDSLWNAGVGSMHSPGR